MTFEEYRNVMYVHSALATAIANYDACPHEVPNPARQALNDLIERTWKAVSESYDQTSWINAPKWARYKAQDFNGNICWFEYMPIRMPVSWHPAKGKCIQAKEGAGRIIDWHGTLEERPK